MYIKAESIYEHILERDATNMVFLKIYHYFNCLFLIVQYFQYYMKLCCHN